MIKDGNKQAMLETDKCHNHTHNHTLIVGALVTWAMYTQGQLLL